MNEISGIQISIEPEYPSVIRNMPVIMKCQIFVRVFGKEELQYSELIPDSDFQSRFDWFIARAVIEIKKKIFEI